MTGTTIAQAIPIAISPILTRLYSPDDFGIFALYMSITSITGVVSTGRYELAVMLPKKDEDAMNIAVLSVFIALVVYQFSNLSITGLITSQPEPAKKYIIILEKILQKTLQKHKLKPLKK
jgi:O-antigen/teichoic acid export membrane protein